MKGSLPGLATKRPERIGAYTFLDEEIQALAAAGIEAFVLSTQVKADTWCGRVRLKTAGIKMTKRSDVARFLAELIVEVPVPTVFSPRLLYRAARLEYLAASMVERAATTNGIRLTRHARYTARAAKGGGLITNTASAFSRLSNRQVPNVCPRYFSRIVERRLQCGAHEMYVIGMQPLDYHVIPR